MKILLATLLLAGACADPHMGDLYGRRTRTALDAQRDAKTEGVALDSADAKIVTTRYHNAPTQGGGQPTGATLSIPVSGSYGGSSGSSSMTGVQPSGPPAGGIRLDAVR
jgi:hypothetical protein